MARKSSSRNPIAPKWVVCIQQSEEVEIYFKQLEKHLNRLGVLVEFFILNSSKLETLYKSMILFDLMTEKINFQYMGLTIILDKEDYSEEQFKRLVRFSNDNYLPGTVGTSNSSFKVWETLHRCKLEDFREINQYEKWLNENGIDDNICLFEFSPQGLINAYHNSATMKSFNNNALEFPYTSVDEVIDNIISTVWKRNWNSRLYKRTFIHTT